MAVTLTTVSGPHNLAPNFKVAAYTVAWDTAYATSGEAIDISVDFDYCYGIAIGGNDTAADNWYKIDAKLPGTSTAVTSSNVLLTVAWSPDGTSGEVFAEFAGNLSAVGATAILVWGA